MNSKARYRFHKSLTLDHLILVLYVLLQYCAPLYTKFSQMVYFLEVLVTNFCTPNSLLMPALCPTHLILYLIAFHYVIFCHLVILLSCCHI
jgi:hypothetical protein